VSEAAADQGRRGGLRRFLRILHAVTGWFLLYWAIGGLISMTFMRHYTSEPSCIPFNSVFGVLQTTCPSEIVNYLWAAVVGWPRFLLVIPAAAFSMLKAAALSTIYTFISTGEFNPPFFAKGYFLNATPWLKLSIPLFLLAAFGANYWWHCYRGLAVMAVTLLLLQIVMFGLEWPFARQWFVYGPAILIFGLAAVVRRRQPSAS
jgi:hypothetical protein